MMTFAEARDWLFQQEPHSTAIIDLRESRHHNGHRYISHEMTILRDNLPDTLMVFGCKSWAEAKASMEAKLKQEDVAA
jgi:hypothetical protein